MIDHDVSHQLHSLAATVDEPIDLVALRRRISIHGRRRAVVKAGVAGAGVAAVVGGLLVVRERPTPAESLLPAASPVASSAAQVEPTALPECTVVLAGLRAAQTTPDSVVPGKASKDTSASADSGFKGIVTIVAIDGPQLTFRTDDPNSAPPTGVATLDATTIWMDGPTQLDSPPTLQVDEQLGLATTVAAGGVDHVLFIDVSASAGVGEKSAGKKIVEPGITLPPGPTTKSRGTITAVDAASITTTLDDPSGQASTVVIDLATTTFYAGNTLCTPGSPTVGEQIGVAYHFDDAGNVIGDAVLLLP